ncbi:hypothetical protein [Krasilnikovia sp. MM14-A1259]|uniref:hypothetical protein n=1 Tax=Krasilnikovia sp. MM14-A1259 TaxID=3373539 RepID=UPI003806539A
MNTEGIVRTRWRRLAVQNGVREALAEIGHGREVALNRVVAEDHGRQTDQRSAYLLSGHSSDGHRFADRHVSACAVTADDTTVIPRDWEKRCNS